MEEVWNKIQDYECYEISNMGNIRRRGRILKLGLQGGYYHATLCRDGIPKNCSIARLVAKAFIPNPEEKLTVDHIDRVRTNNCVTNLRWATNKEQSANRVVPLGKTGHRHITEQFGGFKFQIRRDGKLTAKWCHTLDEALAVRDAYLA